MVDDKGACGWTIVYIPNSGSRLYPCTCLVSPPSALLTMQACPVNFLFVVQGTAGGLTKHLAGILLHLADTLLVLC